MTRAITIVRALTAEEEAVEPLILADGLNAIPAAREHFVNIPLVRNIEDEPIFWRIKDAMHRKRQFHHPEVRAKMSASLAERLNEGFANFFGQRRQLLKGECFDVGWGIDFGEGWFHWAGF